VCGGPNACWSSGLRLRNALSINKHSGRRFLYDRGLAGRGIGHQGTAQDRDILHTTNTGDLAMPTRKAQATWEGGLRGGKGTFRGESGAIEAAYSFGSRFEHASGSNPEELLAAAEAACFSMALSAGLEQRGTPATRVETSAACTIDKVGDGFKITTMRLTVRATVPNLDQATFERIAQETKEGCPVSKAITGNVEVSVEATLG
jgi:osmotically inducible protein OsmC